MFKKASVNSEEFIFYVDLISEFIKKKNFIKSVGAFIKEKAKFNTVSSYGLLFFQKDDNPVTLYDENDFETITDIINEKWESRETNRSFFENGLFYIFSYIAETVRKNQNLIG